MSTMPSPQPPVIMSVVVPSEAIEALSDMLPMVAVSVADAESDRLPTSDSVAEMPPEPSVGTVPADDSEDEPDWLSETLALFELLPPSPQATTTENRLMDSKLRALHRFMTMSRSCKVRVENTRSSCHLPVDLWRIKWR
jgi:hypothetical protein